MLRTGRGGVYEEFSPRNQKIIDDTVEKVRELLANGASPAEIKRVIRGACTEVAKNVGETVVEGVKEGVAQLSQLGTYNDGNILKYSGIGPAYINTGKDLDNDGYHDLVPVAGQDVGDVIDENGNKMQMTTIWDSVIGGRIPYK